MLEKRTVMACGHLASGTYSDEEGNRSEICVIDFRKDERAQRIANLENRIAKCEVCGKAAVSDPKLFNFFYQDEKENDRYYCGCRGYN